MLALQPKDLTDTDELKIYKTYRRKNGQDILGPTKNSKKGGNRNVPIPHWLAEEFRTYCSRLYGLTPDDRVFYMTCTALNKELTRCTQLTQLPDTRVHNLRHSHASLCIELGYSALLVAKRLGDTVPVVMKTYAHLYPNKQAEFVSKLEDLAAPLPPKIRISATWEAYSITPLSDSSSLFSIMSRLFFNVKKPPESFNFSLL